ncbi:MAG: hypothetical protein IKN47_06450 [Lachnospiraceae bacterium]|nr:hypothetical protein [Lachnospiraceae bacterium]
MDILYKTSGKERYCELSEETVKDIALEEVIDYMTVVNDERKILRDIMVKIPINPEDINYRQQIVRDLMESDSLCSAVRDSIDSINVLRYYGSETRSMLDKDNTLMALLENLRELKVWVEVVESLYDALNENDISSEGLINLRDQLKDIINDENFKSVKPDIIRIHEDLSNIRGAIVGVTFTPDLDMESVTAIEFVDYKPRSSYSIAEMGVGYKINTPFKKYKVIDPLLVSMTPYMKKHLWKHLGEVKRLIAKHSKYDTHLLTDLYNSLIFYLSVAELGRKLNSNGHNISFPQIEQTEGFEIKGLYNIRLAIDDQKDIVKNDFSFLKKERIFILTGPNRGGKTILEQGVGLISVMASLGMFVTADVCKGMPFKNILTHFPIDENLTINYGRLGEEAERIREIVKRSDKETLILFNETFSTTSAADALYLSKDLLRILKEKGSYVIFNTHLHELASSISEMEDWEGESDIISVVMEIKDNKNTFKVKRSAPDTSSYARNIAEKYGITYEQMKDM